MEVLAFRQAHKAYFEKSDLFFVCMLRPLSFDVQRQELEVEDARVSNVVCRIVSRTFSYFSLCYMFLSLPWQWMPFEEYAAQPAAREDGLFASITEVCVEKLRGEYSGFIPVPAKAMFCGRSNCIYRSSRDLDLLNNV